MTEPSLLVTQNYIDFSGENATTRYYVVEDVPPVIDAAAKAHADAVHDAIAAVTLCNFGPQIMSILIEENARTLPAFEDAQREMAFKFTYVDVDNGGEYEFTIPGPIMTFTNPGTDLLDLTDLTVAATVADLEADLCSPKAGDIQITSIRFVGRNT